ncbi:MAG: hypothetical protein ACK5LY_06215 [Lachnospirales bacterium]
MNRDEVFETGDKLSDVFSKYFVGQAYLQPLTDKGVFIANVTFEPSCRNNWRMASACGR